MFPSTVSQVYLLRLGPTCDKWLIKIKIYLLVKKKSGCSVSDWECVPWGQWHVFLLLSWLPSQDHFVVQNGCWDSSHYICFLCRKNNKGSEDLPLYEGPPGGIIQPFHLYLIGQHLVTWSHLAARKAKQTYLSQVNSGFSYWEGENRHWVWRWSAYNVYHIRSSKHKSQG